MISNFLNSDFSPSAPASHGMEVLGHSVLDGTSMKPAQSLYSIQSALKIFHFSDPSLSSPTVGCSGPLCPCVLRLL